MNLKWDRNVELFPAILRGTIESRHYEMDRLAAVRRQSIECLFAIGFHCFWITARSGVKNHVSRHGSLRATPYYCPRAGAAGRATKELVNASLIWLDHRGTVSRTATIGGACKLSKLLTP